MIEKFRCGHLKTFDNLVVKLNGSAQCRTCKIADGDRWRKKPENAHKQKIYGRRQRYGPGSEQHYERQMILQRGLCAICSRSYEGHSRPLNQDHDHSCCSPSTKHSGNQRRSCGICLRGLLCSICNRNLGYVEETLLDGIKINPKNKWLRNAQIYLQSWRKRIMEMTAK